MGQIFCERKPDGSIKGLYDGGAAGRAGCPQDLVLEIVEEGSAEVQAFIKNSAVMTPERAQLKVLLALAKKEKPDDAHLALLEKEAAK